MFAAIGVLLMLAGVSLFIIALFLSVFADFKHFIPDDFKRAISIRVGVYVFLAGLVLVNFF
ncbi:MAG: hypothetical protein V3U71_01210 [Cocleimonas sp.]